MAWPCGIAPRGSNLHRPLALELCNLAAMESARHTCVPDFSFSRNEKLGQTPHRLPSSLMQARGCNCASAIEWFQNSPCGWLFWPVCWDRCRPPGTGRRQSGRNSPIASGTSEDWWLSSVAIAILVQMRPDRSWLWLRVSDAPHNQPQSPNWPTSAALGSPVAGSSILCRYRPLAQHPGHASSECCWQIPGNGVAVPLQGQHPPKPWGAVGRGYPPLAPTILERENIFKKNMFPQSILNGNVKTLQQLIINEQIILKQILPRNRSARSADCSVTVGTFKASKRRRMPGAGRELDDAAWKAAGTERVLFSHLFLSVNTAQ